MISEMDYKVTVGIFMLYFFRKRLNEVYIANVPFTKSANLLFLVQSFIFFLKFSSDFAFLISQALITIFLG